MGIVLSIASTIFYTTCHGVMQFMLFLLVDYMVKASLAFSRNVCERRRLWQIEGMLLAVLGVIFFIVDRFPLILFLLSGLSFLSSLPHGQEVVKSFQVYFSNLINSARKKWTSWHNEHYNTYDEEPSTTDSNSQGSQQQRYADSHPLTSTPYAPSSLARPSIRKDSFSDSDSDFPMSKPFIQKRKGGGKQVPLKQELSTATQRKVKTRSQMRTPSKESWGSQLLSYFGYDTVDTSPPGLRNKGQNLCFLNSVVQCLAHLPNILPALSKEIPQVSGRCSAPDSLFLQELCNLLIGCASIPTGHFRSTVDTYGFREAASSLGTQIIAHPNYNTQMQQDAAEFLTWILSTLHDIFLKVPSNQNGSRSAAQVAQIENKLGGMSSQSLSALKIKLFRQLEGQNSMYTETSITAVQTLSDMEWYQLNQDKRSFVSDNFAGQLIEMYENQTNNRVAVGIQLFHILPLPLVEPRQVSGIIQLQDCINSLSTIEHGLPDGNVSMLGDAMSSGKRDLGAANPLSPPLFSSTPGREQSPNTSSVEVRYQTTMRFPPTYLILQLNRFNYNPATGRTRKIKTPVNIPLTDLDLSSTLFEQHFSVHTPGNTSGPRYDLSGLCIHEGGESTENGHYVSYCMASDGNWYKLDDEIVNRVNMTYECCTPSIRRNSYLLFYVRKDV